MFIYSSSLESNGSVFIGGANLLTLLNVVAAMKLKTSGFCFKIQILLTLAAAIMTGNEAVIGAELLLWTIGIFKWSEIVVYSIFMFLRNF